MTHDFQERLDWSTLAGDEPFWEAVYRKAFPDMLWAKATPNGNDTQRLGIDRTILIASGRVIRIDEKKREKDYDDILLEHIGNDVSGSPGWMEKDLPIDYLAYAFMPSKRCYLLDWAMLRRAWGHFKVEWLGRYPRVEAKNPSYKTISVAVPIAVVRSAVGLASIIDVKLRRGDEAPVVAACPQRESL